MSYGFYVCIPMRCINTLLLTHLAPCAAWPGGIPPLHCSSMYLLCRKGEIDIDYADCVSASSLVAGAGVLLLMPIILDALPKGALPIGVHEY